MWCIFLIFRTESSKQQDQTEDWNGTSHVGVHLKPESEFRPEVLGHRAVEARLPSKDCENDQLHGCVTGGRQHQKLH